MECRFQVLHNLALFSFYWKHLTFFFTLILHQDYLSNKKITSQESAKQINVYLPASLLVAE